MHSQLKEIHIEFREIHLHSSIQTFGGVESIYLQFSKVAVSHSNSQIAFLASIQRSCCSNIQAVKYSRKNFLPGKGRKSGGRPE